MILQQIKNNKLTNIVLDKKYILENIHQISFCGEWFTFLFD